MRMFAGMARSAPASPRRATNVTLPEPLLRDARDMGINLSQACERGLVAAVADTRRQRWLEENRDAMVAWNDHVAEHGLPLAAYRRF
jgi:antitoxin CcdA